MTTLWEDADAICGNCGHESWEHADVFVVGGCTHNWGEIFISGSGLVEGHDVCGCVSFEEAT